MKGTAIKYSEAELAWIEANKALIRKDAYAAFLKRFDRNDVSFDNYKALCTRKGWETGRSGCFESGQTTWNKGKKMPAHPNSAKTQFKKGAKPANLLPLWSERLSKDGYIEFKVPQPDPFVPGRKTRWVHKHRYLWEQANGQLAEDMVLKCLDCDKTNTDPSNWEAISRGLLPRLNGKSGRNYDRAEAEVKPTILAIAKLEHQIRTTKSEAAQ